MLCPSRLNNVQENVHDRPLEFLAECVLLRFRECAPREMDIAEKIVCLSEDGGILNERHLRADRVS